MALTQARLDQIEAVFNYIEDFLDRTSATITHPDGGSIDNMAKQIADTLISAYLAKNAGPQDLGDVLRVTGLEFHDGSAGTNLKTTRIDKEGSGIVIRHLDDSGNEISSPLYILMNEIIANIGQGKVLSPKTVEHAGGIVHCTSTPELISGNGIENIQFQQTGFYTADLVNPVADRTKAKFTVQSNMGIYGLQFSTAPHWVSNKTIMWNVRTNWAAQLSDPKSDEWIPDAYVDGATCYLSVFDYS